MTKLRKLWMVLSVTLALSLVWCAVPAFGGWSWDPTFKINKEVLRAVVTLDLLSEEEELYRVKVLLRVPEGTEAKVKDDCGFDADVKWGGVPQGQARLEVVVKGEYRDEYALENVTAKWQGGTEIEAKMQQPHKWVYTFDLP